MKILFIKDVKGTAKRGEVREVADGYAVNYLLPQGLAVLASAENLVKIKSEADRNVKIKNTAASQAQSLSEKIFGRKIEVRAKANPEGKLYAAVSEKDVKSAARSMGFNLDTARIIFHHHLKEVGDYEVGLDFGQGIQSKIIVLVRV